MTVTATGSETGKRGEASAPTDTTSVRKIVAQLRDAQAGQYPVRIERGHELTLDSVYGFVIGVSNQWVAVQAISMAPTSMGTISCRSRTSYA